MLKPLSRRITGVVSEDFSHPLTARMLNEIQHQLSASGGCVMLLEAGDTAQARQLSPFLSGVIQTGEPFSPAMLAALGSVPRVSLRDCAVDGFAAGEATARLLLAEGHRRLGYMQTTDPLSVALAEGFSRQLNAAGFALSLTAQAGASRESGYQTMRDYLRRARAAERIEALFCASDLMALGAMQAVRDFGQGAHVAIVGVGDFAEASASPWHLTSWALPCAQLVAQALDYLLRARPLSREQAYPLTLQLRHSHAGKVQLGEMAQCGCAVRH